MKWAQRFARSVQGVPLHLRRSEYVRAFLGYFENQVKVVRWQVEQAAKALSVLYQEFLGLAWAQKWSGLIDAARVSEATSRPENARSLLY